MIFRVDKIQHGEGQLAAIESLRALAALMVLVYHLSELAKVPLPEGLGFVRNYFGQGVPLFYTLSGFVLAYGYADRIWEAGRSGVLAFYVRRLCRIAPLFYLMLLVWVVASKLVLGKVFPLQTLLLNASFLFGLVPGQHQSIVWAGWSIGIEMLFYLVFPIVALLFCGWRSTLAGFILSCFLSSAVHDALRDAGLESYAYMNLVTHLPFFLAGFCAYRLWQASGFLRSSTMGWLLFALALSSALGLAGSSTLQVALAQWPLLAAQRNAWALVFCTLVLSTCLVSNPLLDRGPLRHLGRLSFSLYLIHPMVMATLVKLGFVRWLAASGLAPAPAFALAASFAVAVVSAASSVTFHYVEKPGIRLGRRLAGRIQGKPRTAQAAS